MSFAEIKKAVNSNLDVPLNTLVEKTIRNRFSGNNYFKKQLSTIASSEIKAIDIQGSGYLYSALIGGTNDTLSIKIIIDDKVVFNANSAQAYSILGVSANYVRTSTSETALIPLSNGTVYSTSNFRLSTGSTLDGIDKNGNTNFPSSSLQTLQYGGSSAGGYAFWANY